MIPVPRVQPVEQDTITAWVHQKETVLVLDNVGNANNFGAIVRSAAFFGLRYIVIEEGQPYLTTSSYRVAEGGMQYVSIYSTNSIADLLKKTKGKITRIGTDSRGSVSAVRLNEAAKNSGLLLILGNEERGISRAVRENCDIIVNIAPTHSVDSVESLNVAQAASILLYDCRRGS
jgi:TrmH RNA methyltransferase